MTDAGVYAANIQIMSQHTFLIETSDHRNEIAILIVYQTRQASQDRNHGAYTLQLKILNSRTNATELKVLVDSLAANTHQRVKAVTRAFIVGMKVAEARDDE